LNNEAMIMWSQGARMKPEAADFRRESLSMSIVLSLTVSLHSQSLPETPLQTLSGSTYLFSRPRYLLGWCFSRQVGQLRPLVYAAAFVLVFCAALLFGV